MIHLLKTHPDQWQAVRIGVKTFEVRYNADRGFKVGDEIYLLRQEKRFKNANMLGPHILRVRISYVLSGYGMSDKIVAFSMQDIELLDISEPIARGLISYDETSKIITRLI